MNLLVLTGYDAAMAAVGDLTNPSKEAYARRHGYSFLCNRAYEADTHPSWQKIRLLQDLLPCFDAILWLDADTLVTNPAIATEYLTIRPGSIIVSHDWSTCTDEDAPHHFSLGNFLITNCQESFRLLHLMARKKQWANQPLWEQQALQELHRENEEIRPLVHILARRALNSVPYRDAPEPWQPGDFLCHFTGIANEIRIPEIRRVMGMLAQNPEATKA